MSTLINIALAFAGVLLTFLWRLAKRIASGALFGIALTLLADMTVGPHTPGVLVLSFALGFAAGFLFYKAAAAFSASLVTICVIRWLLVPWLPCEMIFMTSLALTIFLYGASKTREFVPYTLSGTSALLWFTSGILGLPPALALSSLVGAFAYLLQDASLKARRRYEKLLALRPSLKPRSAGRELLKRRLRERRKLKAF